MKKILVVDDDPKLLGIYTEALTRAGYETHTATNANEVVTFLASSKPDLVLLDIMLPGGKNGFDILEEMKKKPETRKIPVLVLTNLDSERKVAIEIGANDYFVKADTSVEDLLTKVRNTLM